MVEQVRDVDDADDLLAVDDRQATDVSPDHQVGNDHDMGVRPDGDDVGGHNVRDADAFDPLQQTVEGFLWLTLPAAPKQDQDALLDLARWASCRYSPSLNEDGDDGLWLDITGVPHLFGGEQALLADLAGRLARAGFTARLALAETLGAAHALARYGRSSSIIVPHGKIETALAPLPVEALRLEPEIVTLLKRLGLKRIGDVVVKEDRPEIRGMLQTVRHLIVVEEVD